MMFGLFSRYVLAANVAKSYSMIFQLGAQRSGMYLEAKALKFTGVGDSCCVML